VVYWSEYLRDRPRSPGFDFLRYHIFLVGLERGPFRLERIIEKLIE
jgi:hypothetical protein